MESEADNPDEFKVPHNGNPKAAMRLAILMVAAQLGGFIAENTAGDLKSGA